MMKRIAQKLQEKADKPGKSNFKAQVLFFIAGIASTIWFLIRVIPKPSRAAYPCMRAAAPIMSSFIIYIATLGGFAFGLRKAKEKFAHAKYFIASSFLLLSIASVLLFSVKNSRSGLAITHTVFDINTETPDSPIGVAKGYWPGRVVWVMDKDATNENCTNSTGDYWFQNSNTNQNVIDTMLTNGIKKLADTSTAAIAWDCLFKYFNIQHGKGKVGYTQGEKIVVKLNITNMGAGGRNLSDLMDNTPQLVLALLEQLIDTVGVSQKNITIGDPYRGFADEYWDLCHTRYPNVHYIEGLGTDGREQTTLTTDDVFFTSDNVFSSRLPQAYADADYMINMPCMKSHNSAGITLAAKNHQGSVIGPNQDPSGQSMLNYLHYDYPDVSNNQVMGIYRHIVDYMAHSKLGGNTLLYLVDAIWSGRSWNGFVDKWGLAPFNGDFTSSLFLSQDAVAIESVGYDFLYSEYSQYRDMYHGGNDFPMWNGVQDYIHQAADPANWPTGIKYAPDDASHSHPVGSLGVQEHWNNATDKEYSVNLTGEKGGIELVSVPSDLVSSVPLKYTHDALNDGSVTSADYTNAGNVNRVEIFPNPVQDVMRISYSLTERAVVTIDLYSLSGKKLMNLLNTEEQPGSISRLINMTSYNLPSGVYICRITANTGGNLTVSSLKIIIQN